MTTEYKKPLPFPENPTLTKPFWDAAKRHELVMQRCKQCNELTFFPREQCPHCFSQDWDWVQVSGKGRLYGYTVIYQPAHPAFREDVPYLFAIVELDEGPRMPTTIVDINAEDFVKENKTDIPVTVVFDDVTPEWTLVKFKPV
jgi:uncharacterized OB-fold protein